MQARLHFAGMSNGRGQKLEWEEGGRRKKGWLCCHPFPFPESLVSGIVRRVEGGRKGKLKEKKRGEEREGEEGVMKRDVSDKGARGTDQAGREGRRKGCQMVVAEDQGKRPKRKKSLLEIWAIKTQLAVLSFSLNLREH